MNWIYVLRGVFAVAVFVHVSVALLPPDKFR